MANLRKTRGAPLPYTMQSVRDEAGKFVQHACVACCDCSNTASRAWVKTQNPTLISEMFERFGWVIYQNKARCPSCAGRRRAQQHAFARLRDTTAITTDTVETPPVRQEVVETLIILADLTEPTTLTGTTVVPPSPKATAISIPQGGKAVQQPSQETDMQTLRVPPRPQIAPTAPASSSPVSPSPKPPKPIMRDIYLLVIEDGVPTLTPVTGAQTMTLGGEAFLIIPQLVTRA